MAGYNWPRPTVYKTVEDMMRANGAKVFYTRYMDPTGGVFGVQAPDGSFKWYERDYNVGGLILRATTMDLGPAQAHPASAARGVMSGLGAVDAGGTATTLNANTPPMFETVPGHKWIMTGTNPGGSANWKVVPDVVADAIGQGGKWFDKIPWPVVVGLGLAGIVLYAMRKHPSSKAARQSAPAAAS